MGQSSTVHGLWWLGVCRQQLQFRQTTGTSFARLRCEQTESIRAIIPNATAGGLNGQDPFRMSHLNIEDYVAAGYERDTAKQYIETLSRV
jgi:hypothetical protein